MGVVQRVQDCWLGREVALKKIRSTTTSLSQEQSLSLWRFHREAAITSSLEHPNIIPLHDIRMDANEDLYFTMRKVEGETLSQLLKKKQEGIQNKEEHQILAIFFKVCDAVAYAHSRGVIHRDLKPDNIMVGKFGEVYVMDWGIAKKLSEKGNVLDATPRKSTESTVLFTKEVFQTIGGIGTPGYMSPEQSENASEVTTQADIYSLGRILRQCYVLMEPHEEFKKLLEFHKDDSKIVKKVTPPWEQLVPPDIQAIIDKATKHASEERYASVSELTEDILRYLRYALVSSRKYTLRAVLKKWFSRQKKNLFWVGVPLLILSLSFAYFQWLFSYQKEQDIYSARLKAQQALDRIESEGTKKTEQLLSAFHFLTRVLSLNKTDELSQKQYMRVSQKLIDIACLSQNYALADSIVHSLKSLSSESPENLNALEQQIHQVRDRVLQKHKEQLDFWKNKLKSTLLDESTLLQAVLEISQMTEEKIAKDIKQEIQAGTQYFLQSGEHSPRLVQFYKTLVQASGELENKKVASVVLEELEKMVQMLSTFPQGQVPEDAQSYMISLAKSYGNPKNSNSANAFQKIRFQMGEHSCFWDQTVLSWKKLTQHIKQLTPFDKENLTISDPPEVKDLEEGLRLKKKGVMEETILLLNRAIQKNSTYAFAYYHRALCFSFQNKLNEAVQDFSEALKQNPYFLEAYLERGLIYKQIHSLDEAIQDFNAGIQLDPKNTFAYENCGLIRQLQENWVEAINDFNEVFHLKKSAFLRSQQFFDLEKSESEIQVSDFLKQEDVSWLLALGYAYYQNKQNDLALQLVETVLQLQSGNLDAIVLRAQCFESTGSLDLAFQEYEKVLHLEKSHRLSILQCARIWQKKQEWEKARKDYDRAIEFYPKDFLIYEERGDFLERRGNLSGALSDYDQSLRMNPKSVSVYLKRGFILQSQSGLEKALADYQEVIRLDPNNPDGYTREGQIYFLQKKYSEAQKDYEIALSKTSNPISILLDRGQVWEALKEYPKALEDYNRVIHLNPESAQAYFLRGSLVAKSEEKDKIEKCVMDYEKAVQLSPSVAKYASTLGRLYFEQKDLEKAKKNLESAIALGANEGELHYFLGKIYQEEQNLEGALASFNQALILLPSFSLLYLERGKIKESQGKKEEAIADYEQSLKLDPKQGKALSRLSFLKSGMINVDLDQMMDLYTKNIAMDSKKAENYLKRGILFYKKGKFKEAMDDYNQCLLLDSTSAEGYYWRGLLRQEKSGWNLALEDYQEALKRDPQLTEVFWHRGKIYQFLEKWENAQKEFNELLKTKMDSFELYEASGDVSWKLNQLPEAFKYYDQAIKIAPDKAILSLKKGQLFLVVQNWTQAIVTLERAQELDSSYAEVDDALGLAHYNALGKSPERDHQLWSSPKEKERILEFWNQAIQKKEVKKEEVPSLFYFHRGLFLKNTGDLEKGLQDLKLAVKKNGNVAEAHNALGIAFYCQGDFDKALKACDQAISLKPSLSLGYYYRGLIYKIAGNQKIGKVLENFEKAILTHPDFGANYFEPFKSGDLQNHLEAVNNKLLKDSLDSKSYANRGHIFKRMKSSKENAIDALWNFEVFFFLAPEFQEYRHPYHTPKLEVKEFTYQNSTIYSDCGRSFRIHEYFHQTSKMEFSLIPEGVFFMGSMENEVSTLFEKDKGSKWETEKKRHLVVLRSFLLSKTEVSVGTWDLQNPKSRSVFSEFKEDPETRIHIKIEPDYPMILVTWEDTKSFCKKFNLTLPSESQWEYACRAGTDTLYPFGGKELVENDTLLKTRLSEYAWYSENSGPQNQLHKIKGKKENGFGLHDMLGNVWEWCEDVYYKEYTREKPFDGSAWGNDKNALHVYRGGYWDSNPRQCRPAYRYIVSQGIGAQRGYYLGFRLCRNIFE